MGLKLTNREEILKRTSSKPFQGKLLVDQKDMIWLVEQVEKLERYEKAINELEIGFADFGEITGDKRFVYGVRQVKEKYKL